MFVPVKHGSLQQFKAFLGAVEGFIETGYIYRRTTTAVYVPVDQIDYGSNLGNNLADGILVFRQIRRDTHLNLAQSPSQVLVKGKGELPISLPVQFHQTGYYRYCPFNVY